MAEHGPSHGPDDHARPLPTSVPTAPAAARPPLRAPAARERFVADLVAQMSVEEKVGQLVGAVLGPSGAGGVPDGLAPGVVVVGPRPLAAMTRDIAETQTRIRRTARLAIPALAVAMHDPTDLPALPIAITRAATWDVDLLTELAAAAAGALAAAGVHATASLSAAPVLDRAAWADTATSLGCDPVLASALIRAHVQGLQGGAVARTGGGSVVAVVPDVGGTAGQAVRDVDHAWSERSLRASVLPAAESAVRAGASIVVPAAVTNDGVPLHADSRLLQQLVRAEWGFCGVAMAAAGDVLALAERHHVAETADAALALAVESGVQVVLAPAGDDDIPRRMLRLLVEGSLASWLVDAAVVSLLQLKLAIGLFDEPAPPVPPSGTPRHVLAARAAAASTVLLTDPRGVLPLTGATEIVVTSAGATADRIGPRALVDALAKRHAGGARAVGEVGEIDSAHGDSAVVVVVDAPEGAEHAVGKLVAAGRPCVALVSGGDPRELGPLVATTAAVMLCWQPVSGHADVLADILVGVAEPGGRLPVPITDDGGQPVFPLGHGRGYTDVEYSHLRVSADRGAGAPQFVVQCRVTNTGDRPGKEVVQVHLRDEVASVVRSTSLAAFTVVELEPKRTVTVTLRVPTARLAVWNRAMHHVVEPGSFTVFVGRSATDLRLRGTVTVDSGADLTSGVPGR